MGYEVEENLEKVLSEVQQELDEANEELERIRVFASQAYPDFARGRTQSLSSWISSLLKHKVRFTTGDQIFEALRSAEAIRELAEKLEVELTDKAVADYLRVGADATDFDEEKRLLRAAADALEDPL